MPFESPKRIKKLLENYSGNWMICGGWAIDLYLNTETRTHSDIEIASPRNEQLKFKNYLQNWKLSAVLLSWGFSANCCD